MSKIQSQVYANEDAFVFSILVRRNVGATKIAEVETLDENGNATLETQTVDASRPESDIIDAALNAVVATFKEHGFDARANVAQMAFDEILSGGETVKLVVDVAYQKTTPQLAPKSPSELESLVVED